MELRGSRIANVQALSSNATATASVILPSPGVGVRSDVMSLEDLKPGMELTGTVRNVIDFGAFVDLGVHQDGLVHISQISDRFIKHPREVLKVGDIVKVKVLSVDVAKKRIALTMKGL